MTETLSAALAEVAKLPPAAQDRIGRDLLRHPSQLHDLLTELDRGLRSLDAGMGRELDIEDVIRRARADGQS